MEISEIVKKVISSAIKFAIILAMTLWLEENKLRSNFTKTKFMNFASLRILTVEKF